MLDPPQDVENQLNQPNLPTPQNLSNPIQNPPLPPILQRRSTLPSAQATAKHFFRNHTHRTRNHPTPPGLAAANQVHEEGIPTQRGLKIMIDPNKVFQAACAHETSTVAVPEYDNLSAHYTSEDTAKELLKREIARLIAIVENPAGELRFSNQKFLKEGSRDGYIELFSLSKMITQALSIAILDNEVLNLKYGSAISNYQEVTERLDKVLSNRPDSAQNEPEPDSTEDPDEEDSIDVCFHLVNYMTAILIRLITQSGSGDYWHNNLVGVLAKLTVKIKVLLFGLKNSATTSVMGAQAALEGFGHLAGKDDEDEGGEDRGQTSLTQKTKKGKASLTDPSTSLFCVHQAKFRLGL